MVEEFTAQEIRNIFAGLEREISQLQPLNTDDSVYLKRDLSNKNFKIFASEPGEYVDPIVEIESDEESTFAFINRYYMLRAGTFSPMSSEEDTMDQFNPDNEDDSL